MKTITLNGNERIVAAVPETMIGAGYNNRPIWIHIVDYSQRTWREVCLQPEDQTAEMRALFKVLETAHDGMMSRIKTKKGKA